MSVCVCTGAREAPGDVRAEAESFTDISVQWSGLSNCRLVNGRITQYRVRYTAKYRVQYETCSTTETRDYTLGDGENWNNGGRVTLTGLTPSTNYSISVAAVNEKGDVGLYSDPVTTMTQQCTINCISCYNNSDPYDGTDSCESADSLQSCGSTGVIVGVVIGLLGVAVGISGLIGGTVIVKRRRYIHYH